MTTKPELNQDQQAAIAAIKDWFAGDEPYFRLSGPAGTGKTYTMQIVAADLRGRICYTAPTNKATKVLRDTLRSDELPNPDCRTIYSLLGLQLRPNGEIKELAEPEDEVDLSAYALIVVDEASMVSKTLMRFIEKAVRQHGCRFLFMGDPYQLPPVGEDNSAVWGLECRTAELHEVMRQKNAILTLVTDIRTRMAHPVPRFALAENNNGSEGVWRPSRAQFLSMIDLAAGAGDFTKPNGAKVIAWRNALVDEMNLRIRNILWSPQAPRWVAGDRLTLLEPANDLDGEKQASTDDEGTVTSASVAWHPIFGHIKCWSLLVTLDDNRGVHLWAIHADSQLDFLREKERLAADARNNARMWPEFWKFVEAFHNVRHGYAITAHRAQGSTYDTAFVAMYDILSNRNAVEARRCLYVATSRPRKRLVLV